MAAEGAQKLLEACKTIVKDQGQIRVLTIMKTILFVLSHEDLMTHLFKIQYLIFFYLCSSGPDLLGNKDC